MEKTWPEGLEWIHDCIMRALVLDVAADGTRSLALTLECPSDLGYAPWNGKTIVLTAEDVYACTQRFWPVLGQESVDFIKSGVSEEFKSNLNPYAGEKDPTPGRLQACICFTTGAFIEVVFESWKVQIQHGTRGAQ